jgi:hypothetical protein
MAFIAMKKESVFSTSAAWQMAWKEGIFKPCVFDTSANP